MTSPAATPVTVTAQDAAHALPPGTVLAGRYRIEALLGIGGMGMVYRATDQSLGVAVALKTLRPELSERADAFERFRQEVLLARQVSSPHALRMHDIGRDGGRWFISMDLVEGVSLDRRLAREGRLSIDEAIRIARDMASGLRAAHEQGIVHRDLKPSNVLLGNDGIARIADFGIARSIRGSGLTRTGSVVGTPDYLSPEQARGEAVDTRSDLYALGLVLYEMLSGRLPFGGATAAEALSQRLVGDLVPIARLRPDTPRWLQSLLDRLLRRSPGHRIATAEAVIRALDEQRIDTDWRAVRRLMAVSAAAIAVLLAIGMALRQWPGSPSAAPPPQRILLIGEAAAGATIDADRVRALDDWARQLLAADGVTAVVGSERSDGAHSRWRGDADLADQRLRLADEVPHDRLLRLRWAGDADAGRLLIDYWPAGATLAHHLESPVAQDWPDALLSLQPELRRMLERPVLAIDRVDAEAESAALATTGQALSLRWQGRLESAAGMLANGLDAHPASRRIALMLADTALALGDADPARRALDALAAQGSRTHDRVLNTLLDHLARGDREAAIGQLERRGEDDLDASWRLVELLIAGGELERAQQRLETALARDPGDPHGWFLLGKLAILRGDVRPAVDDYLVRAVLLGKRDRNRFGEAEAINALGVGYARLGQMEDAEEQYRRALALREEIGHRRGVANSLRNLAQIAMIRGQRDEAARQLERARGLFDDLEDDAGLAAVDNELGLLAEESGDFGLALQAYRKSLRARERLGDRHGIAESQNNLGFAQFQLGDYDSARVFWQQALESFAASGDIGGQVRVEQNLGLLASARGDHDEAQQRLQASLQTAETQQLSEEVAVSRRNLAELALLAGELDEARRQTSLAAQLFAERDDLRGRIDVALLGARAQLAAGRVEQAEAALLDLPDGIEQSSAEQQALTALLRADIAGARGDAQARSAALASAGAAARRSGIRALELSVRLRADPLDPAIADALENLGHRGLRLEWLATLLGDPDASANVRCGAYRKALDWLRGSRGAGLWRIHQHGAECLRALGEYTAAEQAAATSQQALAALLSAAPQEWRGDIERWREQVRP